jgi:hypothetical protein
VSDATAASNTAQKIGLFLSLDPAVASDTEKHCSCKQTIKMPQRSQKWYAYIHTGLPDFFWFNKPKWEKCTKMPTKKFESCYKIYHMEIAMQNCQVYTIGLPKYPRLAFLAS